MDYSSMFVLAAVGGGLIALSSTLAYVLYGKMTGLSGMLYKICAFQSVKLYPLHLCFVAGLVTSVDLWHLLLGTSVHGQRVIDEVADINIVTWVVGGLLVGFGARWGGGCTSGHGVCGIPRLSKRSFIAVGLFMLSGFVTATAMSYVPVNENLMFHFDSNNTLPTIVSRVLITFLQLGALVYIFKRMVQKKKLNRKLAAVGFLFFGALFGLGLLLSGMCRREKILSFLVLRQGWDPSLAFVMGVAVAVNLVSFQLTMKNGAVFSKEVDLPVAGVDTGVFAGPLLFGAGWGLTGLCPGPALANIGGFSFCVSLILLIFLGQYSFDKAEEYYYSRNSDKHKENTELLLGETNKAD